MSNCCETWSKQPTQRLVILLEYELDWMKIVDFLLIDNFFASPDNFYSPSIFGLIDHGVFLYLRIVGAVNFHGELAHAMISNCLDLGSSII